MKRLQFITGLLVTLVVLASLSFTQTTTHPYPFTYNEKLGTPTLPYYNPLTVEGVELGRLLFYDTLLSGNNKQSCGSCHLQKYSFTDGQARAIGTFGDTVERNTMTLVNMAWNKRFFWDGRAKSIEDLIPQPITNPKEMGQDTTELIRELYKHKHYPRLFELAFAGQGINMVTVSKAIAQFVRTITSNGVTVPDSLLPRSYNGLPDSTDLAYTLHHDETVKGSFYRFAQMCGHCHSGVNYGGVHMADNMLVTGTRFKAPTLINIAVTGPYMHDGRFTTIEQILNHYNGHISQFSAYNTDILQKPIENLIKECDKQNFGKILQLFTDTTVLTDKKLSNPFTQPGFSWQAYH